MTENSATRPVLPLLTDVWQKVLEVDLVRPEDNFFVLGGDSLKATALMVHLEEIYGLLMDPVEIFEAPILRDFAEVVANSLESEGSSLLEEDTL